MIAIYCRKSIYSDKSDSVQNQEKMCRDFLTVRNLDPEISVYTDEGFTGATADRPQLTRLISDIKDGKIESLVVYQLDRLSRSVKDFAEIYDLLEANKVSFLSVRENIDTSSPVGKAMMYITTVFAQMEREQIAQRVTDHMQQLAKKGLWTGGKPPVGYDREKILIDGKTHTTIVPSDPDYVQSIFRDFLQNQFSLQGMETYYRKHGIKTQNGAFFSTAQLHKILTCPFYVPATAEVFDFFQAKGCQMVGGREAWIGSSAVMVYGRTTERNKKHQLQPPSEWIVCKGIHEPIIDAETWLNAQNRLKSNAFNKQSKFPPPLLKGVLKCKLCGHVMQVSRKHYGDKLVSYYYCITRSRYGGCTLSQIRTDRLDDLVLDALKGISLDQKTIEKYLPKEEKQKDNSKQLQKQIATAEKKAKNLVDALSKTDNIVSQNRLISALNQLDEEISELNGKLRICHEGERTARDSEANKQAKIKEIQNLIQNLDSLPPEYLNSFIRKIVRECTFDGQNLFLCL